MRATFLPIATALIIGFPLFSSAVTADEIPPQVQDLQNRTVQLQQRLGASETVTGANVQACPLFGKGLTRGASGDAVTRLQKFLARDPSVYPEGTVNGSYGPSTEVAVKRWQVKFNIVTSGTPASTGFGVAGPRTIAAMISQCQGSTQIPTAAAPALGGFMVVTPISGNVPLVVNVQITVNTANVCGGAVYAINYGDGSTPYQISVPANNCQQSTQNIAHTYQSVGNFQLSLSSGQHKTYATVSVFPRGTASQTQVSIQTGGQSSSASQQASFADSLKVNTASGRAPLLTTFFGVINGQQLCTDDTYTLIYGDGENERLAYGSNRCISYTFQTTHSYNRPGIFTAELRRGSARGGIVGMRTITVY